MNVKSVNFSGSTKLFIWQKLQAHNNLSTWHTFWHCQLCHSLYMWSNMNISRYTLPNLPLAGQKKLNYHEQLLSSPIKWPEKWRLEGKGLIITTQQKVNMHVHYNVIIQTIHTNLPQHNAYICSNVYWMELFLADFSLVKCCSFAQLILPFLPTKLFCYVVFCHIQSIVCMNIHQCYMLYS